ncbi:hypothetical protein ACRAWC_11100 [Leifsonia sp. L25]|uniref:hypothetical protein n=1 Tax=Actinomycetes TaxID=1760 RepID=UPI003D69151F
MRRTYPRPPRSRAVDSPRRAGRSCPLDNRAWLVDWPWVGLATPWFDKLSFLTGLVTTRPVESIDCWAADLGAATPDDIDAGLAAQAGTLLWQSARPAPPALHGLRGLQQSFGLRILHWIAVRRGWWYDDY